MQQNPLYRENLGNWQSYYSHSMGSFFPFDSHLMVYFIIWEMHGFSHQFPIARENATKPIVWEGPRKLVSILFPKYERFFPIWFPSCGILHYMGNAWVFPSISHSMKKSNKIHRMGRTWEIGTHTFPIVWVLFSR